MTFGKKKNRGFGVRKNDRTKKKKTIIENPDDESYEKFFIGENHGDEQPIQSESEDNDTADEYYVILDKAYRYYEHDDLDIFVQKETARVFSQFKESTKSIENENFICFRGSEQVRFVQLYDIDIVKVKKAVTVDKDFRVTIQVNDQKLSPSHDIWNLDQAPRVCHTSKALAHILKLVDSYSVCIGNPDRDLQEHVPVGSFLDSKNGKARQGYRTMYNGTSTIVSSSCKLLVSHKRCKSCQCYRGTLRSMLCRQDSDPVRTPDKDWLSSRVPNSKLSDRQKLFKLKQYESLTKSLKKEIVSLTRKIRSEIDKKGVKLSSEECVDMIQIMSENEPMVNEYGKENELSYKKLFWEQQKKYNELKDKRQMKWHPMLIKWCILLRSKSSSTYDVLRKSGFVSLPSERLLYDYTHLIENGTGYHPKSIAMLKEEMYKGKQEIENWKKIVGIVHDEIRIQSDLVYDKHSGELIGFVDLDKIGNDIGSIEHIVRNEERQLAKNVLVVMVRGVTSNIKFPLAHFATAGVTSDQLFPILWEAVEILELDLGLTALFITSDGASPNRRFTRLHRRGNEEGVIYKAVNIYARNRFIYFISDPPHLIKTTRNCFSNSFAHKNTRKMWNGKDISWLHIVHLFKDHCSGLYRYCPKLTREHIDVSSYGCMKVSYAAQVLSETVASALEILYGELTSETVTFIRHMNKFFDCMNARNTHEGIRKRNDNLKPYESADDPRLEYLLNDFLKYFEDWKVKVSNRGQHYSKSAKNSMILSYQTLEGLEMTVKSVVECVRYCLDNGARYVLTEKFNQDPIEQHFGIHRSIGGGNSNPTVQQFSNAIVRLRTVGGQALAPVRGNTKRRLELAPIDNTPLDKRRRRNST